MTFVALESLGWTFWSLLLGTVVRSSLLAAACAVLMPFLKSRTAEIRHLIWHGMLYGLLILPLLQITEPPLWRASQVLSKAEMAVFSADQQGTATTTNIATKVIPSASPVFSRQPFSWILIPSGIYVMVIFALLTRLMVSLLHLRRIARRSEPILDTDLQQLGHDVWLQSLSSFRPRIRVSADVCVPVAVGLDEISILLPVSWRQWHADKLRAVLVHEMAHVRRGDPATAFLASLAVCLFWIHPLAYWLRRQLAALAEEACDETALQIVSPEQYSRILIDFATDVVTSHSRLLAASGVAVHRSEIKKRLERIFSMPQCSGRGHVTVQALLVTTFFPVLYLIAAAQFDEAPALNELDSRPAISIATSDQASELESDLQKHLEDQRERGALMAFYSNGREGAEFTKHMLWIIDHHPDSPLAGMQLFTRPGEQISASEDHELLKSAWEQAITKHPDSAEVLYHAGLCFEQDDPQRALTLYRRAQNMTLSEPQAQKRYLHAIAVVYSAAVIADLTSGDPRFRLNGIPMSPDVAAMLRAELQGSHDPGLLSQAGTTLVQIGEMGGDKQTQLGLALLQRAIDLDPGNARWEQALESAKAEPVRRRNIPEMTRVGGVQPEVHIGAGVANANLITRVDPEYPPLARHAGIQGNVEFTIEVGRDGHVRSIQLVRGHPLLAKAAEEAVQQWVYQPTLLNGKAVDVTTTVVVPFQLEQ